RIRAVLQPHRPRRSPSRGRDGLRDGGEGARAERADGAPASHRTERTRPDGGTRVLRRRRGDGERGVAVIPRTGRLAEHPVVGADALQRHAGRVRRTTHRHGPHRRAQRGHRGLVPPRRGLPRVARPAAEVGTPMLNYAARRIPQVIPTLLLASIVTFVLLQLVPGDITDVLAVEGAVSDEAKEQIRADYGFDQP